MLTEIRQKPIHIRVLISAVIGILVTCIFMFPFLQPTSHPGHERGFVILMQMGLGLLNYPFALVLTFPLILIAIAVAVIFGKQIEKSLAGWCFAAPFAIWVFMTILHTLTTDNFYDRSQTFTENFAATLWTTENFLYLFGPMPAALIFYFISSFKSSASRKE